MYSSERLTHETRMIQVLEARVEKLSVENRELRIKNEELVDRSASVLAKRIEAINRYDKEVQQIIGASTILSEAWDSFRVQYQLTANMELLETAKEKIAGRAEGICHGCNRAFPKK